MKNKLLFTCLAATILLTSCSEEKKSDSSIPGVSATQTSSNVSVDHVIGLARIEPEGKIANLSSPVSGIVKRVLKQENDFVKQGEVLVELDHEIETARLAQVQSKIGTQRAKITSSEFDVNEFSARAANKQKEYNRLTALLSKGSETQQRVDDVETELNVLTTSLNRATANLELAKSELIEIQKEVALNEKQVEQRFIKAPANGRLLSVNAVAGNALDAQISFAEFVPEGKLIARGEIDELFANKVSIGQTARLRLIGRDETITEGKVIYTASSLKRKSLFSEKAGDQEDRRVREIKIELANPESLLINARVECVIQTKK